MEVKLLCQSNVMYNVRPVLEIPIHVFLVLEVWIGKVVHLVSVMMGTMIMKEKTKIAKNALLYAKNGKNIIFIL